MRPSTLQERQQFYQHFNLKKARDWVGRKLVYLVIIGRHTNIYPPEYKNDKNTPLAIDNYHSLKEVHHYIKRFLPEGVYYDRNYYKDFSLCHTRNLRNTWAWSNFDGQELAFDLDPENVDCPIHGSLQERIHKGQGLSFCETAFQISKHNTLELYEHLTQNYSDVRIVFSGRGFHLHVLDNDTRHLTKKQRKKIADTNKHHGIDSWVTEGDMRLIRLPYTLNGASSRIVTPLTKTQLERFNPRTDALPRFLK
ncbi:MAG: DNA primase small subunit domain-containing protein [Methanobacteriota archaeon]